MVANTPQENGLAETMKKNHFGKDEIYATRG